MQSSVAECSSTVGKKLHVEIRLKRRRAATPSEKQQLTHDLLDHLLRTVVSAANNSSLSGHLLPPSIAESVDRVLISADGVTDGTAISFADYADHYVPYVYSVSENSEPVPMEFGDTESDRDGGCSGDSAVISSHLWELPNDSFDSLWEILYYEKKLKDELLRYVNGNLSVSDRCPGATDLLCLNRLVLLHGAPGTGKTTLCKALAQRLSVRLKQRYPRTIFVEVNSHSLFSRFFSESGKLVAKMFRQICDLLEDRSTLVIVLIDEVESLTMARQTSMSCNEPSDAIRVVNALLTQLDQLRRYENALVFATSNLSEAVDAAFVDRADIKMAIPLPPPTAIYSIFRSCIQALQRGGLISSSDTLADDPIGLQSKLIESKSTVNNDSSELLYSLATASVGLSGRTLRKLPVLAYCQINQVACALSDYLRTLGSVIEQQKSDRLMIGIDL